MQSSTESFWSEIKKYEERLKSDPASYSFAPLAEVYLQAGLLDDALAVARTGVARHPGYAAGQMALARACHQKGLVDECQRALETVTAAVPDHAEAQRLRARLYREAGNERQALRVLQTLLDFCPDDMTARIEAETLQRRVAAMPDEDELELIELTEADIYEEPAADDTLITRVAPVMAKVEDPWAGADSLLSQAVPAPVEAVPVENPWSGLGAEAGVEMSVPEPEAVWSVPEERFAASITPSAPVVQEDPLTTPTLAELYVTQGFPEKAIEIYRRIVVAEPQNREAADRLAELERPPAIAEPEQAAAFEPPALSEPVAAPESAVLLASLPVQGMADQQEAVTVLEGWLENIRRLRVCR